MFNTEKFLKEQRIEHTEDHEHCTKGWIAIKDCPFCRSSNYHLGIHRENGGVKCWKCGKHPLKETIRLLTGCGWQEVYSFLELYGRGGSQGWEAKYRREPFAPRVSEVPWPIGTGPLQETHRRYLVSRRFDPNLLESIWWLKGTGPIGPYKFRIIIPIFHEGKMVSYQGRDITGKSTLRYKACEKKDELRQHKDCLYGIDLVSGSTAVVVEGVTDVWRLGPGAVCTFGIEWSPAQLLLLKRFKNVVILYDSEEQAQRQAERLAENLSVSGVGVLIAYDEGMDRHDPADLPQNIANQLMEDLMKWEKD